MQTVTMLFTDIEGSTNLLNRLGERYIEVLATQRSVLRSAFATWRGREMGTEGDSFFVVFDSVTDAVGATAESQRALAQADWPDGVTVGVRMGLHTGEPAPHEDGYVGMDVHRAARIAGSAHGGQVVVSEATQRIAGHQGLDGLSFVDLGVHRLKDVPGAEHLYQLAARDLPSGFPPLRTLGAGTNLPVALTSLVGRDGELKELHDLVADHGVRLLTLTGPGGSGKTRLVIALAALLGNGFTDGVYFVPLESVTSTEAMWTTIAEVLGVTGDDRAPPTFIEYVAAREVLLVLDNLEQLADAAAVVAELLAAAPGIRLLTTSRRPLHCDGEFEHAVPPLTLPAREDAVEAMGASGAVQLFVQRARMVRPDFALTAENADDVAEICWRLDGLPLAVELAAARVKLLGTRALRTRLDQSLEMTAPHLGQPGRQRTLRAAIEWSYALLPAPQQYAFRQLGAFSGDFALSAVESVVSDGVDPLTHVAELVDVSLAQVFDGPDGEPRVRLLQTISAYARDQVVAASEIGGAARRHAEHYLALAATEQPRLRGEDYLGARDRLEVDLDNLRAALAWSLAPDDDRSPSPDELGIGLRLCESLSWFWYACGYQAEGRRWMGLAVDAAAGRESRELMTTLHGLAVLVLQHGEAEQARDALTTCLEFWRADGDLAKLARELNSLGVAHRSLGEPDPARALLSESIAVARDAGDAERLASALTNLSTVESDAGNHDRAIDLLREALALDEARGDAWGLGVDHVNLAGLMLRAGHVEDASAYLCRHASAAVALGDPELTADVLGLFCAVSAERGEPEGAARLLGAVESLRQKAELPMAAPDAAAFARSLDTVRSRPTAAAWDANVQHGSAYSVEAALAEALGLPRNEVPDR